MKRRNRPAAGVAVNPARLSVVIPVLNEAGAIHATLERLQPMRSRGHELIVVDGGSSDGSESLCRGLVDQLIEAPRGRASQLRCGALAASGSVLWFLHADSSTDCNADTLILKALEPQDAHWGRFDIRFSDDRAAFSIIAFFINLRSRISAIATGDQGIFVTRELYAGTGGIPDIPLMEDIALCRLLKQRCRPVVIRQKLVTSPRRWQKHGIIRTILRMWGLRLAYYAGVAPSRLAGFYPLHKS